MFPPTTGGTFTGVPSISPHVFARQMKRCFSWILIELNYGPNREGVSALLLARARANSGFQAI